MLPTSPKIKKYIAFQNADRRVSTIRKVLNSHSYYLIQILPDNLSTEVKRISIKSS